MGFFKQNSWFILIMLNLLVFVIDTRLYNSIIIFSSFISSFLIGKILVLPLTMFLHAGVFHLLFNMMGIYYFGSVLENEVGTKKFLLIYFLTGLFSGLVGILFYDFSIGASGAVMGIMGALIVYRPNYIIYPYGIPSRLWFVGLVFMGLDLIGFLFSFFKSTGIAHLDHIFGLTFGFLFGKFFLKKQKKKQKEFEKRENIVIETVEEYKKRMDS